MTEKEARNILETESFSNISVFSDSPGKEYPSHAHTEETAHIILQGEMTLDWGGRKITYKAGDRFDIPKNDIHNAVIGPSGCTYMVGDKPEF